MSAGSSTMARNSYHRQHRSARRRCGTVASRNGHRVVFHPRSTERVLTLAISHPKPPGVAIGDLRSAAEIRRVAEQINAIGRTDAAIHNAGIHRHRATPLRPKAMPALWQWIRWRRLLTCNGRATWQMPHSINPSDSRSVGPGGKASKIRRGSYDDRAGLLNSH
jgi:NAD(P)-dependent dehydrogenase (short-subunit alcohol dehydrogenase family)